MFILAIADMFMGYYNTISSESFKHRGKIAGASSFKLPAHIDLAGTGS